MGKIVHSFIWKYDETWKEYNWIQKTTSDWENLINPEYIRFKEKYNK